MRSARRTTRARLLASYVDTQTCDKDVHALLSHVCTARHTGDVIDNVSNVSERTSMCDALEALWTLGILVELNTEIPTSVYGHERE